MRPIIVLNEHCGIWWICYWEKWVYELSWSSKIKPGQLEWSVFSWGATLYLTLWVCVCVFSVFQIIKNLTRLQLQKRNICIPIGVIFSPIVWVSTLSLSVIALGARVHGSKSRSWWFVCHWVFQIMGTGCSGWAFALC